MGIEEKKSIIHRKAKGGRDEFDARVMSSAKSLRLALAKVADKMFGLAVTVTTVEQVRLGHKNVQKEAGNDGLLLLLDGAAGGRGAAVVDPQVLTALIEVQTTGTVRRAAADPRPVTRTDAAIVAPLLDAVLRRYDDQLAETNPNHVKENYRFGDLIEDARILSLALEAPEYDLYRLTLDIEDGAKTGSLKLLLPYRKIVPPADSPDDKHRGDTESLEKHALEAQVVMNATLARIRLPLKEICELSPGMLLPLDVGCLEKAQLVVSGGHVVARVSMGQMNGMRAVRLVAAATPGEEQDRKKQGQIAARKQAAPDHAPLDAMQDDVWEGMAQPVMDTMGSEDLASIGMEADMSPDMMDPAGWSDDDASDETADELSPADLMLAANALQASVRDEREDA